MKLAQEQYAIDRLNARKTRQRHQHRREHAERRRDLLDSADDLAELPCDCPQVLYGCLRPSRGVVVHPEHMVALREQLHDLMLAGRVDVPVAREADDVAVLDHAGAAPSTIAESFSISLSQR